MNKTEKEILDHIMAYYDECPRDDMPQWLYMALEAIRREAALKVIAHDK